MFAGLYMAMLGFNPTYKCSPQNMSLENAAMAQTDIGAFKTIT